MTIDFLPLLTPALLMAVASLQWFDPERRRPFLASAAEAVAVIGIAAALSNAVALHALGPRTSMLLGQVGIGISVRCDVVSVTMTLLVSFIGWIVLRYSATYLDGEPRHAYFTAWLCRTLAFVLLLVTAGNLLMLVIAWIGTSFAFHKLLLFYPDRPAARRAARKKYYSARLGDLALVGACTTLAVSFRTTDIASILVNVRSASSEAIVLAASLLAFAALLKSAQFPTHGWLIEVMETPTPVSALLHAGIVNAGGFLLVRFADVVSAAPGVLAALVMIGGFTALFGGLVMLTQPMVKTSLAWSTVGQMGFMIMECGLGLFPLALLHIVAHSLYKAHAFLSSGGAVDRIVAARRPGAVAVPSLRAVGCAFLAALAIYAAMAIVFNAVVEHRSVQSLALGAILIFGVAYLLAQGFAEAAPWMLTLWTAAYSATAAISYFVLQAAANFISQAAVPAAPTPGPLEWCLMVLAVISFGAVALAQATFPIWAFHPAAVALRVHLSNGCYANAIADRLLGSWITGRSQRKAL